MATRRTQPMRVSRGRAQTRALKASQRGAPAYTSTTHMRRRAALRKKRRRARKKNPALFRILNVRSRL